MVERFASVTISQGAMNKEKLKARARLRKIRASLDFLKKTKETNAPEVIYLPHKGKVVKLHDKR